MKLLAAMSVLLASLTAVPSAQAWDPCGDKIDATIVDVYIADGCKAVEVVVLEDLACLWGTEKVTLVTAGPVTVSYYRCTGPDPQARNAPAACLEKTLDFATLEGSSVSVHSDCTADVVLLRDIMCVGGWVGHYEKSVGPVTVTVYYCEGPTPPPDLA